MNTGEPRNFELTISFETDGSFRQHHGYNRYQNGTYGIKGDVNNCDIELNYTQKTAEGGAEEKKTVYMKIINGVLHEKKYSDEWKPSEMKKI